MHSILHVSIRCGSFSTLLHTALQLAVTSAALALYSFLHPSSQDFMSGTLSNWVHLPKHVTLSKNTKSERWLRAHDSLQLLLIVGSFLSAQLVMQKSSAAFFASSLSSASAMSGMTTSVRDNMKNVVANVFIF